MTQPKITFGFVNCNRLYYLKSCIESVLETTSEYSNKEFIVIDNASVEEGTQEFLSYLESEVGKSYRVKIVRQTKRDPSNEFAKGLNIICREAKGDYIVPLQGDMQFIAKGWLQDYIEIFNKLRGDPKNKIGCIALDAQRNVTNEREHRAMSQPLRTNNNAFVANIARPPISGAADVFYSKEIIEMIYPWCEDNLNHEGSNDSETAMLNKVKEILSMNHSDNSYYMLAPIIPVSVGIYTDKRGTQGRVRKNKRYGDYWQAKDKTGNFYYELSNINELSLKYSIRQFPVGIEEMAVPIGWDPPMIEGAWQKSPIRPETASKDDYVILYEEVSDEVTSEEEYLSNWLNR